MNDHDTALDLATLGELGEILGEGLNELLAAYLHDAQPQLEKLRHAVASGDNRAIVAISHSLQGSSGNLGVRGVSALCQALEQEARHGTLTDAVASLHGIEQAFARAKEGLTTFMAG
jgi:HPt (histidine-containing phosphotransfer) domain-containing protein